VLAPLAKRLVNNLWRSVPLNLAQLDDPACVVWHPRQKIETRRRRRSESKDYFAAICPTRTFREIRDALMPRGAERLSAIAADVADAVVIGIRAMVATLRMFFYR
jgi:hypothetical protein